MLIPWPRDILLTPGTCITPLGVSEIYIGSPRKLGMERSVVI